MKYLSLSIILIASLIFLQGSAKRDRGNAQISEETQACLECHENVTPGIVADWRKSLHSSSTIEKALTKKEIERRISVTASPSEKLKSVEIGCYECHGLNAKDHKDNFDHFGYSINVIVTPNDCRTCHPEEVKQYSHSKKAYANEILEKNPVYSLLVNTLLGVDEAEGTNLKKGPASSLAKGETCFACHGTVLNVTGMKDVESDLGTIQVPKIENWPNHGVGRINPDGSLGSCTACHPRHSFSIETARKPYTCGQCHLEPDVPAYNVYKESKHGNIYESKEEHFNFSNVPWTPGKDFTSPTCAGCHNSLLANKEGDVIVQRTHDFGARLWYRIFGLVYSHPQPENPKTYEIKNKEGLPLPTSFDGRLADKLISREEQEKRMKDFSRVCTGCHSASFANTQLKKVESVSLEADKMVKAATGILSGAWKNKMESDKNPFDENIESLWVRQWLIYANSVRYATAMMGPDYAAFKNGWFELTYNLRQMKSALEWSRIKK